MHKRHYEKFADGSVKDIEDEIPFEVPDGWAWCRLGELFYHTTGKALKKSNNKGSLRKYITTSNLYWNKFDFTEVREMYFTDDELDKCTIKKGDLVLCNGGDVGRAAIWNFDEEICYQNHVSRLRPKITEINNKLYLYLLMFYKEQGMLNGKGVGITSLSANDLLSGLFPLPPINEQNQIVIKIENIFSQIDYIDENKSDLQTAIKQAKSKILDLAIHGKLVSQDPNDEPSSVLLEKIRAEKEAKIANGELKRDKNDSYIYKSSTDNCHYEKFADGTEEEIEVPFELPDNWCWGKLKDVGIITETGYPFDASKFTTDSKNRKQIIRIRDILRGYSETFSDEKCPDSYLVKKGDILVGMDGDFNVGKWQSDEGLLNQRVCRIKKEYNVINLDYVFYLLPIPLLEINKNTSSVTVKHLSNKQIDNLLFPIPPLNEQTIIVNKIIELFSILDKISLNLV